MIRYLITVFSLSLIIFCQQQVQCHYSCQRCAGQHYTLCFTCMHETSQGVKKNITVVENGDLVDLQFKNSQTQTGVCTAEVSRGANGFGVIIIIYTIGMVIVVHTMQSMFLFSTLQNLALLSFIEIAWVTPLNYLLQSLQYYLIFNKMGSTYKTIEPSSEMTELTDQTMLQRQYYRLHENFYTSDFLQNFAIIGFFNLFIFIGGVALAIWKYNYDKRKKKFQIASSLQSQSLSQGKASDIQSEKSKREEFSISQQNSARTLHKKQYQPTLGQLILLAAYHICLTFFYLMILESSLVIMVGLRFPDQIPVSTIAISIIYCVMLVAYLVYTGSNLLWFFPNSATQYINIWRKIGLPVLVITPIKYHYLVIVFMFIFLFLQSFFDYKGGKFKLFSRITLYKLLELIVLIFTIAYYLTQIGQNLQISTNVIRIFLAISILVYFILLIVEGIVGAYYTYIASNDKNKVANQNQNKNLLENTQNDINGNNNVFDTTADNKQGMKNGLEIYDIEDDQQGNGNVIGRSKTEEIDLEEQRRKKQEQQRKLRQEEERRRKQSQERRRMLEENRQRQLQQKMRKQRQEEQKRRKKQQQERRKREQEQQRKRKKLQEEQRKKQEEQRRRKQEEQEKRLRKLEQQRKRKQQEQERRRRQEEQQERIRKQIQEQQELRKKKKKQYKGQMDPQLRKRYGF